MCFKKYIYFFLVFCLSLNVCALELSSDLKKIVEDGQLRVAFVPSHATPYVYYNTHNQLQGFDVELAQHIADALSVKLSPVIAANYDAAVELVANKKAELAISNITVTYERGKYVLFSQPYNAVYLTVVENRQNANAIDLTKEKVVNKYNQPDIVLGIIEGTMFSNIAKKYFPQATITSYSDIKQMLVDVGDKKINAALIDNIHGKTFLKASPEIALSVTTTRVKNWVLNDAIAMDPRHINLMYWLNLFLDTLEDDDVLKEMRKRYFDNLTQVAND